MTVAILCGDARLRADVLEIARGAGYQAETFDTDSRTWPTRAVGIYVIDVASERELETIRALRAASPATPIIALGADPGAMLATEARRAGAHEFLRKPFNVDAIERALSTATSPPPKASMYEFLAADDGMQRLLSEVDRAAATEATIRIQGESGTGKNLLSRRIHDRSSRRAGPRIVVRCAGLSGTMAESELFGHRTGLASEIGNGQLGYLAAASGGTLVLDEVSEISLGLQAQLVCALQNQEVTPVGTDAAEPVDLRLVSTNTKDLSEEVDLGRFREDLQLRLDVIDFRIPPLRERPSDIPLLARALLDRFAHQQGCDAPRLDDRCMARLAALPFRGNVRELENMMRRATILFAGRDVDVDALLSRKVADTIPSATIDTFNLRELEKETIRRALTARGGNRTQAARALGISVRTLRNKIQIYDLKGSLSNEHAISAEHVSA